MKNLKLGYVPLERALSKLGITSRTIGREWILAGKVKVNGVLRRNPQFPVSPERATIEIEEKRVTRVQSQVFAFHKPKGVITTHSDEKGRPTVFSLVTELKLHLIAVGRLDWATSGLILLTNNTKLANWLTQPENGVRRTYLVTVRGELSESKIQTLKTGITQDQETLRADEICLRKTSKKESHLTVYLSEGKNREIRRMFSSLQHEVSRLKRVAYGGIELGDLEPGKWRELSQQTLMEAFPGIPKTVL